MTCSHLSAVFCLWHVLNQGDLKCKIYFSNSYFVDSKVEVKLNYIYVYRSVCPKCQLFVTLQLFCVFPLREPELVLLDMQSVPAGQEGWLAFDVTTASNHWLLHPRSNLGIRLYVETEEGGCSAGLHGTTQPSHSSFKNV